MSKDFLHLTLCFASHLLNINLTYNINNSSPPPCTCHEKAMSHYILSGKMYILSSILSWKNISVWVKYTHNLPKVICICICVCILISSKQHTTDFFYSSVYSAWSWLIKHLSDAFSQGSNSSGRHGLVLVKLVKTIQCHRADTLICVLDVGWL